jgi:hypothetical protein
MMNEDQFWDLIETSRRNAIRTELDGDAVFEHQCQALANLLGALPAEQIALFDDRFRECLNRAYRWDLWAAIYVLEGGCSDDSFSDFRSTLISLGRETFQSVLSDVESLLDVIARRQSPSLLNEGFQYIANGVYKSLAGDNIKGNFKSNQDPAGDEFDFDDDQEIKHRLPRIHAYMLSKQRASSPPANKRKNQPTGLWAKLKSIFKMD